LQSRQKHHQKARHYEACPSARFPISTSDEGTGHRARNEEPETPLPQRFESILTALHWGECVNIYEKESFDERVAIMTESGISEDRAKLLAYCCHICKASIHEIKTCTRVSPCMKLKGALK